MPTAKLKVNDQETTIGEGVTALGRAPDNNIPFAGDANVSRYHAEIESRLDDFWLIDLNSSNGTTVNGTRVTSEALLKSGDQILLGGSAEIFFDYDSAQKKEKTEEETSADESADESAPAEKNGDTPPEETPKSSKMTWLFAIAGLTVGLALVFVVVAVLFSARIGGFFMSACEARAAITKPEIGDIITEPTEIELATENADCAEKAVFLIDGKTVATAEEQPFTAKLNPAQFPDLADGWSHNLTVVLVDAEGNELPQTGEVSLAFETREIEPAEPTKTPGGAKPDGDPTDQSKPDENAQVSAIQTKELTEKIIREQFSASSSSYRFDPEFWREVQKKTNDYAQAGFFAKASAYKDVINEAYIKEQGVDPALGYIFAMSRSKFDLQKDPTGEGLWRMSTEFFNLNGYNKVCLEGETLSDPSQKCAAKASSLYLKELVIGVFEGDVIYSVAAFGKTTQVAGIWKSKLPADRSDFWNVIKNPKEREQIVNFFAAAMVAQNPDKFGLKNDRSLSELYQFGPPN